MDKGSSFLKAFAGCFHPGQRPGLKDFFLPKIDNCFFIRLVILAALAYLIFGFIAVPAIIKGASMEPTYSRSGFNFCWRPRYWFSSPKRGDIVIIRYTRHTLYLKRVIALAGDRVEFRDGKLYLNGRYKPEPYVKKQGHWNLPERLVEPGNIYVVGDNRSMPMSQHKFGQVLLKRLYGAPLW